MYEEASERKKKLKKAFQPISAVRHLSRWSTSEVPPNSVGRAGGREPGAETGNTPRESLVKDYPEYVAPTLLAGISSQR